MPAPTHGKKDNTAKMKDKLTKEKEGQLVIRCIVNCQCSWYLSGTVRIKSSCNLIENSFEIPIV